MRRPLPGPSGPRRKMRDTGSIQGAWMSPTKQTRAAEPQRPVKYVFIAVTEF